jgi:hypothetical protein
MAWVAFLVLHKTCIVVKLKCDYSQFGLGKDLTTNLEHD